MHQVFKSILPSGYGLVLAAFALFVLGSCPATAQNSSGEKGAILSSLSPEEKMKFLKARQEVLSQNPDLKAEQDDLAKQRQAIQDQGSNASTDDKQVLVASWKAHEKKMRDAMLKVDPSLSPIFDEIDQKIKERFQQRAAAASTPAP